MNRWILVVLPIFAASCSDVTTLEPDLSMSPEIALAGTANSMGRTVKPVPLRGGGTWEWDGVLHAPGERCSNAGGMAEAHFTGSMHVTHLGLSDWSAVQCYNFLVSPPQVFTRETFTAANGDQLILFEDETPLDQVPAGYDWGFDFIVEGGSGRFEGATGEGVALGTVEPTATGLGGMEVIEGTISSVGSTK
jgi:hypothetical protein